MRWLRLTLPLVFTTALMTGLAAGQAASGPANPQVAGREFSLSHDGAVVFSATASVDVIMTEERNTKDAIEQRFRIAGKDGGVVRLHGAIHASGQAIAAETRGGAQERFPMVRTSHGLSLNLRNNAVYDRFGDWMIEFPEKDIRIAPAANPDGSTRFGIEVSGGPIEIVFRPRYYQKHKNIRYFEPWKYDIRKDSITGWCSWWAYFHKIRQEDVELLLKVWQDKNLADFGYRFIQLDDGFQGAQDEGRRNCPLNRGYVGGRPETWLEWRKENFPSGMTGYVDAVRHAGFAPGVWIGSFFSDEQTVDAHPGWFVKDKDGKPAAGQFASYVIDSTIPEAANRLIRPTYRGLHKAGFDYVKIDLLRSMLYDNLNHNPEYLTAKGLEPDDIFRAYMKAARKELGDETFILSCWGVLPESVGIADACRIAGDGYGPASLQQYNSWNGIVWRNDPDHCDVRPRRKPAEEGNVRNTEAVTSSAPETIIRPALASIAGAMLMLSDKPEVYADDANLVGVRRSSPVLFSVPGQLYDFDPSKSDALRTTERKSVTDGALPSPLDGDPKGEVCPFWLNEFNLDFDRWNVLHRLNWSKTPAAKQRIRFEELGLDAGKEYLVFEFWTDRMLGVFKDSFEAPEIGAMGLHSFAIRERLDRPQIVSTNRHLSQGAAEIETMAWDANGNLSGRSRVIAEDEYVITLNVPEAYRIGSASVDGRPVEITRDGNIAKLAFLPSQTASVGWSIGFDGPGDARKK